MSTKKRIDLKKNYYFRATANSRSCGSVVYFLEVKFLAPPPTHQDKGEFYSNYEIVEFFCKAVKMLRKKCQNKGLSEDLFRINFYRSVGNNWINLEGYDEHMKVI